MLRTAITSAVALSAICIDLRDGHALQAAGALRVQRAEIIDRNGFEKPLVAYTLLAPAGWRAEGQIEWTPLDPCGSGHRIVWKATAPDGVAAVQVLPAEKWSASNLPPQQQDACLHASVSAARPYLEWWVQRNRPGAKVLDFRPRPDLIAPYKSLNQSWPESGMRSWVDGGELLIAYQQGGRPVREAISSVIAFTHTRFPSLDPNQTIELLQGQSFPGFAMRVPEGTLNFKTVEALRQSIRPGAEWNARMLRASNERHRIAMESGRQMAETNRRAAAERSEIIARTGREVNDIQMGTWQSKNESMDRTQRESIEAIRGVETYNDPRYGGTVQLSSQYQHAWQLNDGSYVLTDDVNFDPSRAFGVAGQRLQVTK